MDKFYTFHGADHKVGVTMIAQSVAEIIASERPNMKILLITLSGKKSNDYLKEEIRSIDGYRNKIESKIIEPKEFRITT